MGLVSGAKRADKLPVIVDKDHKECSEVLGRHGEAIISHSCPELEKHSVERSRSLILCSNDRFIRFQRGKRSARCPHKSHKPTNTAPVSSSVASQVIKWQRGGGQLVQHVTGVNSDLSASAYLH